MEKYLFVKFIGSTVAGLEPTKLSENKRRLHRRDSRTLLTLR